MTDMNKEDQELAEIFSGEEKPLHPDTVHISLTDLQKNREARKERTASPNTPKEEKAAHKPTHNYNGKSWEPVRERTWMDALREGSKWVALFGGLSVLVWYWQVSGLMDSSVAVPTMCACTALAGWNLGKCARG